VVGASLVVHGAAARAVRHQGLALESSAEHCQFPSCEYLEVCLDFRAHGERRLVHPVFEGALNARHRRPVIPPRQGPRALQAHLQARGCVPGD